ncbi:TPA: hypothetical protein ACPHWC_006265 [Pseudomonas aeruginosa]|uniref:hypothetical protein n=1 Tax=Pseudomonas aeruginosa TaxID=287 RepID=UPI0012986277|nr:hypothetical protein [Pseudomonas aeruginosa]EKT8063527.1 hypothetical protein [Pseudomonas aeruginosa]EKV3609842.1 hypothetical protein [Pseudomonas aeruginosa]EKW6799013.1 hypothetical protein [Pseudomonas aeruginosa]ELN4435617.1 hypothetical protein [Pseudomonas aeruginosa]ELO0724681.1 hypothetical protein [Pseudomonas aeruginosa]
MKDRSACVARARFFNSHLVLRLREGMKHSSLHAQHLRACREMWMRDARTA